VAVDVETYYQRYGPMVLRRCRRLLGDEEEAVSAMQDTFVKLIQYQDRLEDRGGSSLMYRMATNVCLNQIRTRKRHPEDPDSELLSRIAEATRTEQRTAARGMLSRLLQRHPESTGDIAVMHLLDGMTLEEVADTVGLSVSGVRKRLRKLRGDLHQLDALEG